MDEFEETFKTKAQDSEADKLRLQKLAQAQEKRGTSLIDMNRARNLCKLIRFSNHFYLGYSVQMSNTYHAAVLAINHIQL